MISLRIGTRQSDLAVAQTNIVINKLNLFYKNFINIDIFPISTKGDEVQDKPLREIVGKAVFSKSLHQELLKGTIDCAVHSLKDLEPKESKGIQLACVLEREDPRDIIISKRKFLHFEDIPAGWVLGTSSPRRQAQFCSTQPNILTKLLRGNIKTRLDKLVDDSSMDGTVLAYAGLLRLGLIAENKIQSHNLWAKLCDIESIVPAAGQGVIAVDCRANDTKTQLILKNIHCEKTYENIKLERFFVMQLSANCETALGVYVECMKGEKIMHYNYYHPKKEKMIKNKLIVESKESIEKEIMKIKSM